jgi:hypothetical protein
VSQFYSASKHSLAQCLSLGSRSYYTQHFIDTFRQGVIDLLLGNLDDISEICRDDPIEQIANIAQSALVPTSRAPKYFNYGVMGNELRLVEDTIVCARCMVNY